MSNKQLHMCETISSSPQRFAQRVSQTEKPRIQRRQIGEYSIDGNNNQRFDRSERKYLWEPILNKMPLDISLTQGFGTFVEKAEKDEIEHLLRWLIHRHKTDGPFKSFREVVNGSDFVTSRGSLIHIASSPYTASYDQGVKLIATNFRGVCFLREFDTERAIESGAKRSEYLIKSSYAGRKLQALVTTKQKPAQRNYADGKQLKQNMDRPVNANEEFHVVFSASFDSQLACENIIAEFPTQQQKLDVLFCADIDCFSTTKEKALEVKSQCHELGYGKDFDKKALKMWIQSYLIGAKEMIVGLHDQHVLREVIRFPVDNLRAAANWNTRVCFAFLYDFLTQIKRILNYLPEGTFLRVEREPGGHEFKLAIVRFSSDDLDADRVVFFGKEFAGYKWD